MILLGAEAPRVMTVPMIAAAFADRRKKAARNTVFKWIRDQTEAGVLRPVTRGLYLNQLARPQPTAAEAASFVRSGAIVSLRLLDDEAGDLEDRLDLEVLYARTTAEKALLDWIYLGASPRTKLAPPPLDIDLER